MSIIPDISENQKQVYPLKEIEKRKIVEHKDSSHQSPKWIKFL